ncbi:hypothetical protein Ae201684_001061 [Aphanomyces euteiches]|uniref:non-specific serine/threonine protein kinase n=1 Tax=Aphanomyces euteiches TaxID=100861 RepID=A0A6G0XV96_9STRA|nr:hypothetical protein Ae201684_001061 [Aphanomyces euteiches]
MQRTVQQSGKIVEEDTPFDPWNSRRSNSIKLHSYESPVKQYVEVKIGGHTLDHKHVADPKASVAHAPMKVTPKTISGHNQASVFQVHHKERMQYVEVKIGGHRYDHKRCVATDETLVGFNNQLSVIKSGSIGCALCFGIDVGPLVHLYCRHAVCIPCFDSFTQNGTRVLCQVCFKKVPFLHPHMMLASQQTAKSDASMDFDKMTLAVSCVGLGYAGPKVVTRISHALRGISIGETAVPKLTTTLAHVNEIIDTDGAQSWRNRVQLVMEPSKLLRYEYVDTLGQGNFSQVLLMKKSYSICRIVDHIRRSGGALCVLKESDKLQEAMNEISVLSKLHSPHVVRLNQYFIEQVGHLHYAYLELEYCDRGNMAEYIASQGKMDHDMFARVMLQLCSGLAEIHRHNVVHRDLKPANILLTSDGVVKISDFGVSTCLESALVTRHAAGTMSFMAPEVRRYFLGESVEYDWAADIWSLGAVAVALLTGMAEPKVATRPVDDIVDSLTRQNVPANFVRAVQGALEPEPSARASLEQLQAWIASTYSKL